LAFTQLTAASSRRSNPLEFTTTASVTLPLSSIVSFSRSVPCSRKRREMNGYSGVVWVEAIERAAVPIRFLPEQDSVGASLYEALSARGFKPTRGLQRLRATILEHADAELLGVAPDSPALYIQRIAYLAGGACVEFTKSWYRADAYDFVSELTLSPPARKTHR